MAAKLRIGRRRFCLVAFFTHDKLAVVNDDSLALAKRFKSQRPENGNGNLALVFLANTGYD
jgi:hypothetical protein